MAESFVYSFKIELIADRGPINISANQARLTESHVVIASPLGAGRSRHTG